MYKLILAVILTVCLSAPVFAADVVKLSNLNVSGDTLYLPSNGSWAVGVGTNIATFVDLIELRGVFVSEVSKEQANMAGVGLGVNIVKAINKLGGDWLAGNLNSSVGVTALANLDGKAHVTPAAYISLINWEY